MSERLRGFAMSEFETILEERKVVERLNAMEDLFADAKRRKARVLDGEGKEGGEVVVWVISSCFFCFVRELGKERERFC